MYPQVFGKYVLERELARGGMARVLLATLKGAGGFEKKLVVKQIRDELSFDEEFVRRFVEEAKTTVALSHPNIVPVYELGVELGTYFLAMEFVEGASMAELLKASEGGRLSPEEGAYVGVEVCRALDYAHRRMKVVHRDITPRNVMVDEEGQVKVIDFGIAARASVAGHEVFGSPGHMPPEQAAGKEVTPATDVFAVAVLLMEAWNGKAPFRRKDVTEAEALMRAPHPKASDADIRLLPLDDVIGSALSLDPALRPQDAEELGRALRRFLAGIDLGDVAQALGERVRQARKISVAAAKKPGGLQQPPSRPSEIKTKTFAARDEVLRSEPSAEMSIESSTRRLPLSTPPSPAVAPLGVSATEGIEAIETVATRPIATERRERIAESTTRTRVLLALAGAAIGMVGVIGFRYARNRDEGDAPVASASAAEGPAPLSAQKSETPVPSAAPPPPSAHVAPRASVPAAVTASSPTAAPASAETASKGRLALFGDPGTRVAVDGVPRGACPRELSLDSGPHDVRFTFDPTGESRGERVTLSSGQRVIVRADFTGASPTIRVQR